LSTAGTDAIKNMEQAGLSRMEGVKLVCRFNLWRNTGLKYTDVGQAAAGVLAE